MEITGYANHGAPFALAARAPVRPVPDVPKVAASDGVEGGRTQGRHTADTTRAAGVADMIRNTDHNRDKPAGPPPSFDISVLEKDRELLDQIARFEATRGHEGSREDIGVKAQEATPPAADPAPAREPQAADVRTPYED